MPLSVEDSVRAVSLIDDGGSYRYVTDRIGASIGSIHRAVQRFREFDMFSQRPGSCRKRSTTKRDDRFMTLEVLRDWHTTAVQVQNLLRHFHQLDVNVSTIRRRLQEANLKSRRPATGQLLTRQHRITRLDFAHQHINWTEEQWGNILFTDESSFSLRGADGRERVWRKPGERYYPCTFSERIPLEEGLSWYGLE